jgi:hypothetical protein
VIFSKSNKKKFNKEILKFLFFKYRALKCLRKKILYFLNLKIWYFYFKNSVLKKSSKGGPLIFSTKKNFVFNFYLQINLETIEMITNNVKKN